MRALVRSQRQVELRNLELPKVELGRDVLVRVVTAGLCRTDCEVADGNLGAGDPLTLGHEFAGYVSSKGGQLPPGTRVACMPLFPCGKCNGCLLGRGCAAKLQLGVDLDGAFADYVSVPESSLFELPAEVDFQAGAFAEPVAAAMAVLDLDLPRCGPALVLGGGRIAELTLRVLRAGGYAEVELRDANQELPTDHYLFCVETRACPTLIAQGLRCLAPGGTLVLKSRSREPVALDIGLCVKKRLRLLSAEYANITQALQWVAEGRLQVRDLFADPVPLEAFEAVLEQARRSEEQKLFFQLDPAC